MSTTENMTTTGRGGRPPLPQGNKRSIHRSLYLTEAEWEQLRSSLSLPADATAVQLREGVISALAGR